MNGNVKWMIGVLGSIAGLAENSRQRQKQSAAAVGSWQCQLPTAAAYCRCLLPLPTGLPPV